MSLDDLTKNTSDPAQHDRNQSYNKPAKKSKAWLLPVSLIIGFILITGLFFGDRLIPATEVEVSQVVTIRASNDEQDGDSDESAENPTEPEKPSEPVARNLLFQASGWVEPDPYTTYVPTLVSGIVDNVKVLEGAKVKKGDLLAQLIKDDAQLELDAAERKYTSMEKRMESHISGLKINLAEIAANDSKIDALESRLADVEDYFKRVYKLSSGSISQQTITKAKLAVSQEKALLEEAKAEIPRIEAKNFQIKAQHEAMEAELLELATVKDKALLHLKRTDIHSPIDGIVLKLHAAPGRKRMLDSDSPDSAFIVELYDPQQLQARIDVPLNEAAALQVGQNVEMVSDILADQIFTGKVTRISGQADLQRNTLQVKVAINQPDEKLRPDMLMRAKFYDNGKQSMGSITGSDSSSRLGIYVNEQALVGDDSVWVVSSESTATLRTIKLSTLSNDGYRLVQDGLRSGESVILPPHDELSEGMRVKPIKK